MAIFLLLNATLAQHRATRKYIRNSARISGTPTARSPGVHFIGQKRDFGLLLPRFAPMIPADDNVRRYRIPDTDGIGRRIGRAIAS